MSEISVTIHDGSDALYMDWLAHNPDGFVVNSRQDPDPNYTVLHRSTCHSISQYTRSSSEGAFTERSYIKICSLSIDALRDWVKRNGRADRSFSRECGFCNPTAKP